MNDSSHSICGYTPGSIFDGPVVLDSGNSEVQIASHEPSSTSHIDGSQMILDFENGVVCSTDDVRKTFVLDDTDYGSRDVCRVIGSSFVGDSYEKYFRQSGSMASAGESSLRCSMGGQRGAAVPSLFQTNSRQISLSRGESNPQPDFVEIPSFGFGERYNVQSFCRSRGRKRARNLKAFGGRVEVDDVRLEDVDRGGGKVVSQWSRDPPDEIKKLFGDEGSLYPTPGNPPRFLQLYIYNTDNEVANRIRHFPEGGSSQLDPEIVSSLIRVLDTHNELVRIFRTTRDIISANVIPEFWIRLFKVVGVCEYDLPTSGTLGEIVFESGPNTRTDYDVIIESRDGCPQRVNKLHPLYMALQFPLLFVYGESGFHPEMKQRCGTDKRMSMNIYYMFQLHERLDSYGFLFRGGRLFQQYVIGVYCCIEQNRLDFYRLRQNDIRREYLSGVYDAICRGDREGSKISARIILPRTFTGGPHYMYSHYLDALAICRALGNL
ncbi:DNA helicase [Tanacetum coccineum]